MFMNSVVMSVSVCLRDAMGAVLSWFTLHLSALLLETADALKRWRVSKSLFNSSFDNYSCTCACVCVCLCVCFLKLHLLLCQMLQCVSLMDVNLL